MTVNDLIAHGLKQSLEMLKMHVADLSDADLLVRPVPAANHANWQIGHLIISEQDMMTKAGAKLPELSAGFAARYAKEASKIDDPKQFASKADLLATFEKLRAATIAWVASLSPAQLQAPSPMPQWFPTTADYANLGPMHLAMHLGQIQVVRRKLGRPHVM